MPDRRPRRRSARALPRSRLLVSATVAVRSSRSSIIIELSLSSVRLSASSALASASHHSRTTTPSGRTVTGTHDAYTRPSPRRECDTCRPEQLRSISEGRGAAREPPAGRSSSAEPRLRRHPAVDAPARQRTCKQMRVIAARRRNEVPRPQQSGCSRMNSRHPAYRQRHVSLCPRRHWDGSLGRRRDDRSAHQQLAGICTISGAPSVD